MLNKSTNFLISIFLFLSLALPAYSATTYATDLMITKTDGIWTDSRSFSSLSVAVTNIGTLERDLYIAKSEVLTTLTIPSNIRLHFLKSGAIANSGQLTIQTTQIFAGDQQIFKGTGDIDFASGTVVRSSWFADIEETLDVTSDDTLTVVISRAETLDVSVAVGTDVTLQWNSPFQISVNTAIVLSNLKNIIAGNYQIFAGAGDIDFLDGSRLKLSWFPHLRSFNTWIESEEVTLVIDGTHTVTLDETLTSNIILDFISEKGMLTPDAGISVTANSPEHISALPSQQIIDPTNNSTDPLLFTLGGTVHPGWWGSATSISVALAATSLNGIGGVIECLSTTYTITTLISLSSGISIKGTHVPTQMSPGDVLDANGTIFHRTADIGVISTLGTDITINRAAGQIVSGIAFINDLDVSAESIIYSKWSNNIFIEKCTFFEKDATVTIGHSIDVESCWDWTIRDCTFKGYGNAGGTKFAINLYNGASGHVNYFRIIDNIFGNGNGTAIYSDATGAGSIRNSYIWVERNKFEDNSLTTVQPFITGEISHMRIRHNEFVGGDSAHVVLQTVCDDWDISNNRFGQTGATATELLDVSTGQRVRVISNSFSTPGASVTAFVRSAGSASRHAGGATNQFFMVNNSFYEAVEGTTPMLAWTSTYLYDNSIVKDNSEYQNETVTTGSPALMVWPGYSKLNSVGGAITATLSGGIKVGDVKTIVMTEASNPSTVTVANHAVTDPEICTFNAVDDTWMLVWTGTEWADLYQTCTP